MPRFSLRRLLVVFALFAFAVAGIRFLFVDALGPAIPPEQLKQLKPGMTKSEVEKIVGKPDDAVADVWHYERPLNPGWVGLYFDEADRLLSIDDERALSGSVTTASQSSAR
jgi:hypothetical protein